MKVLIAGATGMVGGEAARILSSGGDAVRALVRSTSNAEKTAALKGAGIEVVEGDLRDRASLDAACDGVDAVISTISAMPFSWSNTPSVGGTLAGALVRCISVWAMRPPSKSASVGRTAGKAAGFRSTPVRPSTSGAVRTALWRPRPAASDRPADHWERHRARPAGPLARPGR